MPNTKDKRLTWKMCIDGHEDVGLCEGVTVGDAICKLADIEEAEHYSKVVEIDQFNKWISVKERLPERFVYVLVMTDFGEAAVARLKGNGRWYIGWDNDQYAGITHWMPLPEPPKEV